MKIIARTSNGYLVEASEDELAVAAGYRGSYSDQWRRITQNGTRSIIGVSIQVIDAFRYHTQIEDNQEKAKSAAGVLRALAEMIENGLPNVVLPPPAEEEVKP